MAGGGIKINNVKINGGADGATFTPMVDAEGNLSWSNNKGYTNPATVNIKGPKGDKGEKGDRGLQGVQGVAGPQGEQGIQGATGAKLISQELVGQDENGGNIYQQTFDDGTVAYFTAPKGEASTEEGEDLLTKTEADETYLPFPANKTEATVQTQLYKAIILTGDANAGYKTNMLILPTMGYWGFGTAKSSGGYNLVIAGASTDDIDKRAVYKKPIIPGNLDYAIKVGITTNTKTLTDEEKEAAQTWLGVKKYYTHALIFHKSGSLNFTVDRITSEPTAYLNCTTPIADNLFCTNSKSIVLNGVNDPSGVKSGVGTLMATMTPYDDENGENSGVKLSGVWINYATGEVSQVSNFEVPFEQDVVTEL